VALPYGDVEPQDAWQASPSNHYVVQRVELLGAPVTVVNRRAECHTWLRRPTISVECVKGRLNLERFSAGKEPDLAKVDTEERGGGAGDSRGGT
jgi:hypothetical protein